MQNRFINFRAFFLTKEISLIENEGKQELPTPEETKLENVRTKAFLEGGQYALLLPALYQLANSNVISATLFFGLALSYERIGAYFSSDAEKAKYVRDHYSQLTLFSNTLVNNLHPLLTTFQEVVTNDLKKYKPY